MPTTATSIAYFCHMVRLRPKPYTLNNPNKYIVCTKKLSLQPHPARYNPHMMLLQALGTVHIPDATPESELVQVLAILGALAAENDKSTLLAVLQGLSPQVLADCVIANMAHLPAASSVAGAGGSAGGLAGLMQVLHYYQLFTITVAGAGGSARGLAGLMQL